MDITKLRMNIFCLEYVKQNLSIPLMNKEHVSLQK